MAYVTSTRPRVAACRDVLRLVSAQERSDYKECLERVIEEADDLSQALGVVWTDGRPAYQGMEYDYRYVAHYEKYGSGGGVPTKQT